MADGITLDVDLRQFEEFIRRRVALGREPVAAIVRAEGKLLAGDLTKLTPPFGSLSGRESWGAQRRIGNRAIEKDINRAFKSIDDLQLLASPAGPVGERALMLLRRRDFVGLEAILRNVGISDFSAVDFLAGELMAEHEATRDNRGRVRAGTVARWARGRKIRKLIRDRQKAVGKAKAGWGVSYMRLGGRVPAWISRHGSRQGFLSERVQGVNPRIVISNSTRDIRAIDRTARVVPRAVRIRTVQLKRRVDFLMRRRWRSG